MNKSIFKFKLNQKSFTTNRRILRFLAVQNQYETPVVWAEVDLHDEVNITYDIYSVGTGWTYGNENLGEYIGTTQDEYGLVYHHFVKARKEKQVYKEREKEYEKSYILA